MAHFAQLDENNIVTQVVVIHNNEMKDKNGVEKEENGINFLHNTFGANKNWVQTSYNNNFRKHYAGIGYIYNKQLDAFIRPQPYPSWILNNTIADWEAPIPLPSDAVSPTNSYGKLYSWDESIVNWLWQKEKQPYRSWIEIPETGRWKPPVAIPSDVISDKNPKGKVYVWNESLVNWEEYVPPEIPPIANN